MEEEIRNIKGLIAEDWRYELDKIKLITAMHKVSEAMGRAKEIILSDSEHLFEKKKALQSLSGAIQRLIDAIPHDKKEHGEDIEKIQKKLLIVDMILSGNKELAKKYGISFVVTTIAFNPVKLPSKSGMLKLFYMLDDIIKDINEFTYRAGLRMQLPREKETGALGILKKENINLELFLQLRKILRGEKDEDENE